MNTAPIQERIEAKNAIRLFTTYAEADQVAANLNTNETGEFQYWRKSWFGKDGLQITVKRNLWMWGGNGEFLRTDGGFGA